MIIRPRQATSAFPSGYATPTKSGIANGLRSLIVGANPYDIIADRQAVSIGANQRSVVTVEGEAQHRLSGGARFGEYRQVLGQTPNELTIFCSFVAEINNTGDDPSIFGASSFQLRIQSYSGGKVVSLYSYYYPSYTGGLVLKTPNNFLQQGKLYSFVATAKSEGRVALFCNGQLIAEGAYPAGRRISTYFDSSSTYNYGSIGPSSAHLLCAGTFDRALLDEEAISLSSNPKQLFEGQPARIYALPAQTKEERSVGVVFDTGRRPSQDPSLLSSADGDAIFLFSGTTICGVSGKLTDGVPNLIDGSLSGLRRDGYPVSAAVTQNGVGARMDSTSAGLYWQPSYNVRKGIITSHPDGSPEVTIVCHMTFEDLTVVGTIYRAIFGRWHDTSASYRGCWQLRRSLSDATLLQLAYRGSSALVTFDFNTRIEAFAQMNVVITIQGSTIRGYVNGRLDFESPITLDTATPSASARAQRYRIGSDGYSYNSYLGLTYQFAGLYNRAFTHEEAIAASESYMHLLKRPQRLPLRFYAMPSGQVIVYVPVLSLPGVTDITKTSALPYVTLTYPN